MKIRWDILPTRTKNKSKGQRDVNSDGAQQICFKICAKASSCIQVDKALKKTATWLAGWFPNANVDQPIKQINANTKLQCVFRAGGTTSLWAGEEVVTVDKRREEKAKVEKGDNRTTDVRIGHLHSFMGLNLDELWDEDSL